VSRRYVLDASALSLYFAGREEVKRLVDGAYSGKVKLFMCEVNVAEFLYSCAKVLRFGQALAVEEWSDRSRRRRRELTVEAARLKLKHAGKLSLADCYLVALAKLRKATVVTADSSIREVAEAPVALIPL